VPKYYTPALVMILIVVCASCQADSWTAFSNTGNPPVDGYANEFVFSLVDGRLSLNAHEIVTVGGSSSMSYTLLTAGEWAVCGVIDASGILARDPYATFIADGIGGYISWHPDAPYGHTTSLILGGVFANNEAATFTGSWWGNDLPPVTGTLLVQGVQTFYQTNVMYDSLDSHSFDVVNVPEPSSLLALAAGGVGLSGMIGRSRLRRRR
jgi:hypothetical protein